MEKPKIFNFARLSVLVWAAWIVWSMPAYGQELLKDLIETRKQRMAVEMQAASKPLAEQKNEALSSLPPQLWSLAGIQNDVMAEWVWRGQVLRVPLRQNEAIAGPWRIKSFSASEVTIVDRSSGRIERLKAPAVGTSISAYTPYFSGTDTLTSAGSGLPPGLLPPPPRAR